MSRKKPKMEVVPQPLTESNVNKRASELPYESMRTFAYHNFKVVEWLSRQDEWIRRNGKCEIPKDIKIQNWSPPEEGNDYMSNTSSDASSQENGANKKPKETSLNDFLSSISSEWSSQVDSENKKSQQTLP